MKKTHLLFLGFTILFFCSAHNLMAHSIKGVVKDQTTNQPIVGAAVMLFQDSLRIAVTITNEDGTFVLENVEIGRYYIQIQSMGYQAKQVNDVNVRSGNQTFLEIKLEESNYTLDEVEVTLVDMKGDAQNEFTIISARTFSIEETERYAGSRGDPARMAANYAGVVGNNDNSNDIVIRGNTPIGLLWRMDGVNIPNPSHFASAGNSGGPVTILNNQTLANSDFLTGAFAAGFGNTIAGVFDLKSRNGNNSDYEYSTELGFLGLKLRAEGPFSSTSKGSFLAAYRYSTLASFSALNVDLGTDDVPYYQDLNLKFNFPLKNGGNIGIFGIGGLSRIDILRSESADPFDGSYGDPNSDEQFKSQMGVVGVTYSKSIGTTSFMQLTASYGTEGSQNQVERLTWDTTASPPVVVNKEASLGYKLRQDKASVALLLKQSITTRSSLKYGLFADLYLFNYSDSIKPIIEADNFVTRLNYTGNGTLIQPYVNWKYSFSENVEMVLGIHGQYFTVSNSSALEPRIAFNYKLTEDKLFSFGAGMHSQMLPTYIYFVQQQDTSGTTNLINEEVDFLRSLHFVLGYSQMIGKQLRFKTEVYYQHLYNIPVTVQPSSYSILNEGADGDRFFPARLDNQGTGQNYGAEVTLEKFFSKGYFFMITGSIFNSDYLASDQKKYNTVFNSKYAANLLGAKEFVFGSAGNKKLTVGGKLTFAGGRWYTPLDLNASAIAGRAIYDVTKRNSLQFKDYFRFDINLKYRIDLNKVGHEFGLDLVNLLDIENPYSLQYNSFTGEGYFENQLGFLPIFYYRVDF